MAPIFVFQAKHPHFIIFSLNAAKILVTSFV